MEANNGKTYVCTQYSRERQRMYYQSHRLEVLHMARRYRLEHPEKIREYSKKYYQEHKEKLRAYAKSYYADNAMSIKIRRYERASV